MEIPHINSLKQDSARALSRGRDPQKVIVHYAGIMMLIAAFATVASFWLRQQISGTGGLGNLGTRSILSTAQTILPTLESVLLMCLEMGYLHAMIRIARGQYADHTDLKVGFQRFFPVLRLTLLQAVLYFGISIAVFYFSMQIYILTPWSDPLYEILEPIMSSTTVLDPTYVLDDATVTQATRAMLPMMIIFLVVYLAVVIPVNYRLRMANYALLDNPQKGGMAALRASNKMMRRNGIKLFTLDLHFWWYYGLSTLATVICYGDVILALLGIPLPFSETVSFFVFYGLYLAVQFAILYFLRNRVEVTYIMAYESICEKPEDSGVVLGNIFDM